jgi:hypothetical protein
VQCKCFLKLFFQVLKIVWSPIWDWLYFTLLRLGHMIPLWKGKNPIYFGVITIVAFDNLYRRAFFVMHTFLVWVWDQEILPSFTVV